MTSGQTFNFYCPTKNKYFHGTVLEAKENSYLIQFLGNIKTEVPRNFFDGMESLIDHDILSELKLREEDIFV